jgi:3-deoxy-manno-octulosonate cytidylyltransferase (CMP-KDO synthetase)
MIPHPEFTVLIPARRASTRLPDKALADLGGKPMVVRVAEVAVASGANRVVVATDDPEIQAAVQAHGHESILTRADHPTGTDRLAEAAMLLDLGDEKIVVNLQGDEPAMEPALVRDVARLLAGHSDCAMSTAAHPILSIAEFLAPSVVKVVLDAQGRALVFSRAPIPFPRDAFGAFPNITPAELPDFPGCPPLRHLGIYAYRAGFLRTYPTLEPSPTEAVESLEQLRALWHGYRIAVTITTESPAPGVDTPADLERMRARFEDPSLHCGLTLRAPSG